MQETKQFSEIQQEEILALQSIYSDYITIPTEEKPVLSLDIPIELNQVTRALISSPDHKTQEETNVSFLPPIKITITLPLEYPDEKSPAIDYVTAKTAWLTVLQTEQLENHLIKLWLPGSQILFEWLERIRSGQFLDELHLLSCNVLSLEHSSPRILSLQLALYTQQTNNEQFAQMTFDCAICLSPRRGSLCVQLTDCGHVFCRACLRAFWASAIASGNLFRVGCADMDCVKARRKANASDVRAVFGETSPSNSTAMASNANTEGAIEDGEHWLQKWMRWQAQRDLAKDKHVVYCPVCQEGVRRPPEAEDETSGWHRHRICGACKFSFCKVCRRTWHGPQNVCQLTEDQIVSYIHDREGQPEEPTPLMKYLETEYGVDNVKEQVDAFLPEYLKREKAKETKVDRAQSRYHKFMDEISAYHGKPAAWDKHTKASLLWILNNTVLCPKCKAPGVKEPLWGCNMVECICGEPFCWACGKSANSRVQCACYHDWNDIGYPPNCCNGYQASLGHDDVDNHDHHY